MATTQMSQRRCAPWPMTVGTLRLPALACLLSVGVDRLPAGCFLGPHRSYARLLPLQARWCAAARAAAKPPTATPPPPRGGAACRRPAASWRQTRNCWPAGGWGRRRAQLGRLAAPPARGQFVVEACRYRLFCLALTHLVECRRKCKTRRIWTVCRVGSGTTQLLKRSTSI